MTEEQYAKASELMEQRNYYKKLADDVKNAQSRKAQEDEVANERIKDARENCSHERWILSRYFRVRLFHKKATAEDKVGLMPRWELAREIEINADPELIDIIREWLEKKVAEYDKQIEQI